MRTCQRSAAAGRQRCAAAGADPNVSLLTDREWTALMVASNSGHEAIVEALLCKGAEKDATDSRMWTALMIASHKGHVDVVNALLRRGADVNVRNDDDHTAVGHQ